MALASMVNMQENNERLRRVSLNNVWYCGIAWYDRRE